MGARASHRFLAPRWALTRSDDRVTVQDLFLGEEATLRGAVADELFENPAGSARRLLALGALEPMLGALGAALGSAPLAAWDRAALLRGGGYAQLFLELTARCNERCLHCYAESSPERTESLSAETVRAVLDAAARLGFRSVQLTGGDPLIADTCVLAATHARAVGIPHIEVYTNGVALRGPTFDALRDLGVSFAFSFYSHRPEVHDAITRHPGSQVRTLEAIGRALAAGLALRVNVILLEANADDLEATVALLRERGVPEASIGHDRLRTVGRGATAPAPLPAAVDRAAARPHHTSAAPSHDFGGRIAVLPDGSVTPCIFAREPVLGNVLATPLDAILRAPVPLPPPERLAQDEAERLARGLACRECQVRAHLLAPRPLLIRTRARA